MSPIYEVWDTETAHQVGAFASEDEAVAVLRDVLKANGPDAVREMLVLMYPAPGARAVLHLEGATFLASTEEAGASVGPSVGTAGILGAHGAIDSRGYRDGKRVG